MDFGLSSEQRLLGESVRKVMDRLATPQYVRRLDSEAAYPYELYDAWTEMGLLRMPFPEAHGGLGGTLLDMVIIAEELARKSFDFFTAYGASVFCGLNLLRNGSPEQCARYLPKLLAGEIRMCVSMSEPDAESDTGAMRSTARRVNETWRINGQKLWSTGAGARDTLINVYVKTDSKAHYREGMSLFLVANDTPGVELRKLDMLGRRSVGTYEIFFNDVEAGDERLVGGVNRGFQCLLSGLQTERITTAAGYCGAAQGRARSRGRLREDPQAVRTPDRVVPGDRPYAGRPADRGRCRPAAHAACGLDRDTRRGCAARNLDGQAVRFRDLREGR